MHVIQIDIQYDGNKLPSIHVDWPRELWWLTKELAALPWLWSKWYEPFWGWFDKDSKEVGCWIWCSKEPRLPLSCCLLQIWLMSWLGTENLLRSEVKVAEVPKRPPSLSESPGVEAVVIAIITVVVDATLCSCIIARSSEVATDATESEWRSLSMLSPVRDSWEVPLFLWLPPKTKVIVVTSRRDC